MKCLVFDTGPVISMALNGLLWLLEELEGCYDGDFLISPAVKRELVDKPLRTQRYKLEAFQVLELIGKGVLKVYKGNLRSITQNLEKRASRIFKASSFPITVLHSGEIEAIALAVKLDAGAIVVDERTTRLLIERPDSLRQVLSSKLHTRVEMDENPLRQFKKLAGNARIIRSVELVTVAYEMGLFNRYLENLKEPIEDPGLTMLKGCLWALKLKGATVSRKEIEQIIKLEA